MPQEFHNHGVLWLCHKEEENVADSITGSFGGQSECVDNAILYCIAVEVVKWLCLHFSSLKGSVKIIINDGHQLF